MAIRTLQFRYEIFVWLKRKDQIRLQRFVPSWELERVFRFAGYTQNTIANELIYSIRIVSIVNFRAHNILYICYFKLLYIRENSNVTICFRCFSDVFMLPFCNVSPQIPAHNIAGGRILRRALRSSIMKYAFTIWTTIGDDICFTKSFWLQYIYIYTSYYLTCVCLWDYRWWSTTYWCI